MTQRRGGTEFLYEIRGSLIKNMNSYDSNYINFNESLVLSAIIYDHVRVFNEKH